MNVVSWLDATYVKSLKIIGILNLFLTFWYFCTNKLAQISTLY